MDVGKDADLKVTGHVPAAEAGKQFGYTNDYVARLAREKKIVASRVGRQWFVDVGSLQEFVDRVEESKREQSERLREERLRERMSLTSTAVADVRTDSVKEKKSYDATPRVYALAKAGVIMSVGCIMGAVVYVGMLYLPRDIPTSTASLFSALRDVAIHIYGLGAAKTTVSTDNQALESTAGERQVEHEAAEMNVQDALIVLPSGSDVSIESIREHFSDDVHIDRVAKDEGVVTPVFRNSTGTPHRFLLVPISRP